MVEGLLRQILARLQGAVRVSDGRRWGSDLAVRSVEVDRGALTAALAALEGEGDLDDLLALGQREGLLLEIRGHIRLVVEPPGARALSVDLTGVVGGRRAQLRERRPWLERLLEGGWLRALTARWVPGGVRSPGEGVRRWLAAVAGRVLASRAPHGAPPQGVVGGEARGARVHGAGLRRRPDVLPRPEVLKAALETVARFEGAPRAQNRPAKKTHSRLWQPPRKPTPPAPPRPPVALRRAGALDVLEERLARRAQAEEEVRRDRDV